jgi:hypothetical protein
MGAVVVVIGVASLAHPFFDRLGQQRFGFLHPAIALGNPPRGIDALAIGVEKQRYHHCRMKRRLASLISVGSVDQV